MVEKKFHSSNDDPPFFPNFGNATKQVNLVYKLMELNKKKNLGLRFPTTVRLRKRFLQPPTIIQSYISIFPYMKATIEQQTQFLEDRARQIKVLEDLGYRCDIDTFFPTMMGKSKKMVAIMGDFGSLREAYTGW